MCFDHIYSGTLVHTSNFAAKTDPVADFPMGSSALGFPWPIQLRIFPWAPAPSDFHVRSSCGFSHGRQRPRISMSDPDAETKTIDDSAETQNVS